MPWPDHGLTLFDSSPEASERCSSFGAPPAPGAMGMNGIPAPPAPVPTLEPFPAFWFNKLEGIREGDTPGTEPLTGTLPTGGFDASETGLIGVFPRPVGNDTLLTVFGFNIPDGKRDGDPTDAAELYESDDPTWVAAPVVANPNWG